MGIAIRIAGNLEEGLRYSRASGIAFGMHGNLESGSTPLEGQWANHMDRWQHGGRNFTVGES